MIQYNSFCLIVLIGEIWVPDVSLSVQIDFDNRSAWLVISPSTNYQNFVGALGEKQSILDPPMQFELDDGLLTFKIHH